MNGWFWADVIGSLCILLILFGVYWHHFREKPLRRYWSYFRYQGGGVLKPPKLMTELEAVEWIAKNRAEVTYIDRDHGFIFYRPEGS